MTISFVFQVVVLLQQCLHRRRKISELWLQLLIFTPLLQVLWLHPFMVVMIWRKPLSVCYLEDQGSGENVDCIPLANDEPCPPCIYCSTYKCEVILFSRLPDGLTRRGDINLLMLGDPGTAKSQLLKFVERCSPIGVGLPVICFITLHLLRFIIYILCCLIL